VALRAQLQLPAPAGLKADGTDPAAAGG
jgi:hypothetical protein